MHRLPGFDRRHTPTSDHLNAVLREPMREIESDDYKYDLLFDRFECLLALSVGHLMAGPVTIHPYIAEARPKVLNFTTPMPVGRFGWRRRENPDIMAILKAEQQVEGSDWPPLKAKMFDGHAIRFKSVLGSLESRVHELDWR